MKEDVSKVEDKLNSRLSWISNDLLELKERVHLRKKHMEGIKIAYSNPKL